jgi:hypothetical protein
VTPDGVILTLAGYPLRICTDYRHQLLSRCMKGSLYGDSIQAYLLDAKLLSQHRVYKFEGTTLQACMVVCGAIVSREDAKDEESMGFIEAFLRRTGNDSRLLSQPSAYL